MFDIIGIVALIAVTILGCKLMIYFNNKDK